MIFRKTFSKLLSSYFHANEPNNEGNQDCAKIGLLKPGTSAIDDADLNLYGNYAFQWDDYSCYNPLLFACEGQILRDRYKNKNNFSPFIQNWRLLWEFLKKSKIAVEIKFRVVFFQYF